MTASSPPWVFKDNLFDKVTFLQDTTLPLDHDHNAYWRRLAGEFNPNIGESDRLAPDTGGTVDQSSDVLLTTGPFYQASTFGDKYVSSSWPTLVNAGSRSPAAAGVYHFTTLPNQTKDAAQAKMNIGLHYVAAVSGKAADFDNDGIPDYVENWHGDGNYSAHTDTETDWQNQQTIAGTPDASNVIYDDLDLDGDGMVGRIEKALGTNPLIQDNPLSPAQVITGDEPQIVTLKVPVNYTLITNVGSLQLTIDANNAEVYRIKQDANGNCLVRWNTTFTVPGEHFLSVNLKLRGLTPNGASQEAVFRAAGPFFSPPVRNILHFNQFYSTYNSSAEFYAELAPNTPHADYIVSLFDPTSLSTTPFQTITGSTSSGLIDVSSSVTDQSGAPYTGPSFRAVFQVTPPGSTPETDTQYVWYRACLERVPDGAFAVAYTADNSTDSTTGDRTIQLRAVDPLLNPYANYTGPLPGPAYLSSFNTPSYGGLGGYAGYLPNQDTVEHLIHDELAPITRPCGVDTRNFFFLGHGSPATLENCNDSVVLTIQDVGSSLGNYVDEETTIMKRDHPYRFVFLHACRTADDDGWCKAFGIIPDIQGIDILDNGLDAAQAFVGWKGENAYPADEAGWTAYQNTLNVFFGGWQLGDRTIQELVDRCQKQYPYGNFGPGWPMLPFPFQGRFPSCKLKIFGFNGLTRTGAANPVYAY